MESVEFRGFTITEAGWENFHITKNGGTRVLAGSHSLASAKVLINRLWQELAG